MALTGTLSGTLRGREYRIEWSATQSIADNTSTITCVHKLINNPGYSLRISGRDNTCTVGSNTQTYKSAAISTSGGSTITLGTTTHTIQHDNDGKKTVDITGTFYIKATLSGTYVSTVTASGTITLDTIPRASSLSLSVSSADVGGTITVNITRATSSFTHVVEFYINDTYYQKFENIDTSKSFQIPTSWYSAMPSSISCTAYCRITTYNKENGQQIGSQVTKSFTVNVPPSIVPEFGIIELDPDNITTQDNVERNILVKNKNKMVVRVYNCKAGEGSSIKSYTFQAISGSTVISSVSTTNTSASLGPFSQTGAIKFRVIVTDNRSRSVSNEAGWECHDYIAPYFSSFSAYRANSNASVNVNGEWLMCTYTPKYSSVNNTNNVTVTAHYYDGTTMNTQTGTDGEILINLGNNTKTYKVYLTMTDNYGGYASSFTETVFGQSRIFNVTKDGTGFAIGKIAEKNNYFECRWTAKFDDDIYSMNDTIVTSDKKVKRDIENMSSEQERLFNGLRPVTFKFQNGSSDRTHYGFISQDVEDTLHSLKLTGKDFAGFCKDLQVDSDGNLVLDENGQAVYDYALRYSEFIALNTFMIQKLQAENAELKAEIQELKEMIVGTSSKNIE